MWLCHLSEKHNILCDYESAFDDEHRAIVWQGLQCPLIGPLTATTNKNQVYWTVTHTVHVRTRQICSQPLARRERKKERKKEEERERERKKGRKEDGEMKGEGEWEPLGSGHVERFKPDTVAPAGVTHHSGPIAGVHIIAAPSRGYTP